MSEIVFTSSLAAEHAEELEQLLFFNGNQARATDAIAHVAERYGHPKIQVVDDELRVDVASRVQTQTLFVVEQHGPRQRPVGVIVFTRETDVFVALYLAVHEDFCSHGPRAGEKLLLRMVGQLEAIARRVKGLEGLRLYLRRATAVQLPVRRA
jgi:hypothetical protein